MITKRNGKYFREKIVEEEISATEALEARIAELEDEIAELKRGRPMPELPYMIPGPCPYVHPLSTEITDARLDGLLYLVDPEKSVQYDCIFPNLDCYVRSA